MDNRSITRLLRTHLDRIEWAIIKNMDANGRNASNRSIRSLRVEVNGAEGVLWGLTSFLVMERGRKAGRVPRDFQSIIRQWIIDKGINVRLMPYKTNRPHKYSVQERSLRCAAGAIAYKIMKAGTRLHRQQGFDDIFSSITEKELALLYSEITSLVGLEIDRINQN